MPGPYSGVSGIVILMFMASTATDWVTASGTLVAAIVGTGALLVAALALRSQVRVLNAQMNAFEEQSEALRLQQDAFQLQQADFQAQQRLREQHQASKVAAWSLRRTATGRPIRLHNGSDAPIYMCCLWLVTRHMPTRPHPPTPLGIKPSRWTTVVAPEDNFQDEITGLKGSAPRARPPVEAVFKDADQQFWWRDRNGELKKLDPDQVQIFIEQFDDLPKYV